MSFWHFFDKHVGHFSFSQLFLNIVRYTLIAMDVFLLFLFFLNLLKLFFENIAVVCFSRDSLVWQFSAVFRGKSAIFRVQNFSLKKMCWLDKHFVIITSTLLAALVDKWEQ